MDTYWEPNDNKRQNIMKTIIRISTIFLVLALIIMAFKPLLIKTDNRDKVILTVIKQSLEAAHYEHIVFDDNFSSKAFDEYLSKLDYSKRFLLKSDVELLSKYRYAIDDEIKNAVGRWTFSKVKSGNTTVTIPFTFTE